MNDPKGEGILLVDKEKGWSAFYLVKLLRKLAHIRKIGHAGILDPFATGVMVMLIGRPYTKISNQLINDDKEYIATLKLGAATNTFDCDGRVTKESSYVPEPKEIAETLEAFQGNIEQIPPMFSAKKLNGKKLYLLARQGIEVDRKPIRIKTHIEMLHYTYPGLKIRVSCSKGTYVRSLAHDIGIRLNAYAHLSALQRTQSGVFKLKDCIDAKSLSDPSFPYMDYLRKQA